MTNKDTKSGDNTILEDGDNEIVDNNEVCEILIIIWKYCFLRRIWLCYY